jgi:ketosteroid isomerase-like protein
MVSQENLEVVRAYFEARRNKGREGVFEFLSPSVEWEARSDLPDTETYIGHDGVRALFSRFREVMDDMWFQPDDFILAGEQVLVPLRWGGRGRGSGVVFEEREEAWTFTVRNGAITRVKEYATKEAALEAVGLSKQEPHADS